MGAMPEEIAGIADILTNRKQSEHGGRTYYSGQLYGNDVVLVFSRWGKVAAATTVTTLILEFKITHLFFTGVAGAINPKLKIGDIVIADRLIQHDMDARPLIPQYEIPLLHKTYFETDAGLIKLAVNAANQLQSNLTLHQAISEADLLAFKIKSPAVYTGTIASGDKFISGKEQHVQMLANLPDILCVEMEGAAVAQVCFEYGIPCSIIRTISDSANEEAHFDFPKFIQNIAGVYSFQIIRGIFGQIANPQVKF